MTPTRVDSLGSVRTGDIMRAFYSASKGRYSSDSDPDDDPVITGKRKERLVWRCGAGRDKIFHILVGSFPTAHAG